MRCEELENIIFSGGEVTPAMREHARHCEACRMLLEHAQVLAGVRDVDEDLPVPPSFAQGWRRRVRMEAAARRPKLSERVADWLAGFNRRTMMRGVALAACAVVLLGVGSQLGQRTTVNTAYDNGVSMAQYNRSASPNIAYSEEGAYLDSVSATGGTATADSTRKIVRTAQMDLNVEDVDAAVENIRTQTEAAGGTVDYCEVSGQEGEERTAYLNLSIPSEGLDAFLSGTGSLGVVTREVSQTSDLTDQYVDNDSRLQSALAQKQRLDELYAQAENMTDIIAITDALYDVQWQIDSLTGANAQIDTRVELSQVTVTLKEDPAKGPQSGFASRLLESAKDGLSSLWGFGQNVVLFVVWVLPWAACLAVLGGVVFLVFKIKRR